MKTNPTCVRPECPRTFNDELNFCQLCGATLTSVASPPAALDPYKTVVGTTMPDEPKKPEFDPYKTVVSPIGSIPPTISEPVIEESPLYSDNEDSMKTMIADPPSLELPSTNLPPIQSNLPPSNAPFEQPNSPFEPQIPAFPSFNEPSLPVNEPPTSAPFQPPPIEPNWNTPVSNYVEPTPIETPSFGSSPVPSESQPPPSPFDSPFESPVSQFEQSAKTEVYEAPRPTWQEPEPPQAFGQNVPNSFGQDAGQWTPPPAPVANWENQSVGQNTPFNAPPAGVVKNQTLAIASLGTGIAGFLLFFGGIVPFLGIICGLLSLGLAIAAIITGILARIKTKRSPEQYGGGGLALGGIIAGVLTLLLFVGSILLLVLFVGLSNSRQFG